MSFDPVTMLLAGTAVKAVGSIAQGESQAGSYEFNASVARQNALIAAQQGAAAVDAQQRNATRRIGSMIAAYGASGVQGDAGSPMDVLADSARMAELDKLTTQYNYTLRAAGYESQAKLDLMGAESARTSGYLNAFSGGLQGVNTYVANTGATRIPIFGSGGGAAP